MRGANGDVPARHEGQEQRCAAAGEPAQASASAGEKRSAFWRARALLFKMAGVDLTVIEGISETTALVLLSELGTDLSKFPHEKNFVSWLGLCPQHRGSAG